ncbi:hypothetical protein AB6D20_009610 [Vibrio splendidus]|uniref:hypothetical protein n=1 Tax=Vibrio TaxID=662 RepID=UPI000769CCEF|nr:MULTISPECIES: hypothetical protein [Vibrio]TVU74160.1 hypothetical protein FQP87_14600 [Vibrio tasmaniensis]CAH7149085.1 conserved hypothetical protein [Vibrio chagasii]MCF7505805.1 hypothetical protein [Vibrio sp. L3-7]MDA0152122.1 hypothetical protein [Vibrio sp. Makdt]PHX06922.1 hypothetical protein VSPL_15050 [Vibrio splendidus]
MPNDFDLDELMSDEFLDSLDDTSDKSAQNEQPSWVVDDPEHTTHKAYHAILDLKKEAEEAISSFGEVVTNKTKKFYQIKKSNVARVVGRSAQSIFNASSFSRDIEGFFDDVNQELLEMHEIEQKKQLKRKKTGIRVNKKEVIVQSHQSLEKKHNALKARSVKETLDLAVAKMPLDLKAKMGLM